MGMYDDVKILKASEAGTGMLIEHDAGYISPEEPRNKALIREFKSPEFNEKNSNSFIVYVVLQKYDVKNRNGRIYPKQILVRQNEIYQEAIRHRRALGECVPSGTEIFTNNGWRLIEDMKKGDNIFTLNLETNKIELQLVTSTINKLYTDDIVHIYNNKSLDMKLTKGHKVLLWDKNGNPYEMTAIELYDALKNKNSKVSHSTIKCGGKWDGSYENYFTLPNTKIKSKSLKSFSEIFISEELSDTKAKLIPFNDNVYCVSVPNKTWLMRHNGYSVWTHNCDHPETSVISIDRISHNIIETWWEGHTLMGKMEIPMTKGFINYGVVSTKGDLVAHYLQQNYMIGVSSRGVGSLKEVKDDFIVQDDFELICWDIVTAPSTPGSWMFKDKSEARPYVENILIKKNKLNESLDNFLLL